VPDDDLVRADLFRRFGFYPTESSEHHAEYNPWFIPKGQVEPFNIPIGEYLSRVANNLDEYAETKRKLDAGEPFEIEMSGEYAAVIVQAMTGGAPARIVANVPNDAGRLIPNLAAGACVEVPALVDGLGVHPVAVGPLPPQCAAYTRPAVDCQELTVEAALAEDRDLVYHAVLTDPQVQAALSLDEAWRMTDELIAAEAEWLPGWLGGDAPDWLD
jgi:alpha-galactosidase